VPIGDLCPPFFEIFNSGVDIFNLNVGGWKNKEKNQKLPSK
jgi:hypothetical protein